MRADKLGLCGGVAILALLVACTPGGDTADNDPEGVLAFNSERDGNYEVYVMPIGGPARNISTDSGVDWAYAARNGVLYAVSTREGRWPGPAYDLYAMDPDDGALRRITDALPVYDSFLGADPAGDRIAVCSRSDGDEEIYVIDLAGMELAKLTDNDVGDCDPDWSPDGRWIAFQQGRGVGHLARGRRRLRPRPSHGLPRQRLAAPRLRGGTAPLVAGRRVDRVGVAP